MSLVSGSSYFFGGQENPYFCFNDLQVKWALDRQYSKLEKLSSSPENALIWKSFAPG
jgi:hypothetical protein